MLKDVVLADDDDPETGGWEQRDTVRIGERVDLAPGFIAASHRHPSGVKRWYVRGPDPLSPSGRARLPAIVTCKCGRETELTNWMAEADDGSASLEELGQRALARWAPGDDDRGD